MTVTHDSDSNNTNITTQNIAALKADVDRDPTDLVAKISLANALEESGQIAEAKTLYQEVVQVDPEGSIGAIARKALETLEIPTQLLTSQPIEVVPPESQQTQLEKRSPLQWFYNLPISRKLVMALFLSEIVSILGLSIGAKVIFETGLRSQLRDQAKSEAAVTEINYNIKVDQMEFGARSLAENSAIITAAKAVVEAKTLPAEVQQQIKQIFQNEIQSRRIEYTTLVGKDLRIIANANADRKGEVFNPNNLVSEVLASSKSIKTSEPIAKAEIAKESPLLPPGFKNQDGLIRYTLTPVKDPATEEVIAVLLEGDIVNGKWTIVENTLNAFGGGYSGIYLRDADGKFALATSLNQTKRGPKPNVELSDTSLLSAAALAPKNSVTQRMEVGGQTYTMVAKSIANYAGNPVAVLVRGTPETAVNNLLDRSQQQGFAIFFLALVVIAIWVLVLRRAIVKPLERLQKTTLEFSAGDRSARAEIFASDEVGQLAINFNQMADSINTSTTAIEEQSRQRMAEAQFQRQEKEKLQQGVVSLLLDIEDAKRGDLTVRAKLDESEMGSIADAFNATIHSLNQIVTQVKTAASQVHESAFTSETSVEKLSQEAIAQAQALTSALNSVEEMGQSIQSVATSAQQAATIARKAVAAAQKGGQTMDRTVGSIQNIRASVAETSKKVKRLAESSQEISKIVSIISGISEKTNLLAFNASIEAARAGEHGQGFRVVADEVRHLAERVTDSTKEIEQLVNTIQQETAEVLQTMEASTTHVVTGTQLVASTKQTLQGLAQISQKIDFVLQSISASTVSQAGASQMVNSTMREVVAIATSNSAESQAVATSLEQLVTVAQELTSSVSRFRVEK